MIKTLVSLNADLASSIALRFVCRMAEVVKMGIETIHVEETDSEGNPPGTGWVRRTWEKGLLGTAEAEISQLINAERSSCPTLGSPKMMVGEREAEILRELEEESYDLLVEGILLSFDASHFENRMRSKLYTKMPCPLLLVKNLVGLKKIALLVEDHTDLGTLVPIFSKLFEEATLEYDLLRVILQKPGRLSFKKDVQDKEVPASGDADEMLTNVRNMLVEAGSSPQEVKTIRDIPARIADSLQEYSLVASCVPRQMARKSPMLEVLSRVPSAVLLCWQ
jgi:hypothetical protein